MAEGTFERDVMQAVQQVIVEKLRKGDWLQVGGYGDTLKMSQERLRKVYEAVDMGTVLVLVKQRLEERIADSIINAMATEVATDVKQILCNKELREDLRAILREKMRATAAALQKETTR